MKTSASNLDLIKSRILALIVVLGMSLPVSAQMSGVYTITGNSNFVGREFRSFNEAVDSLENQGVSGAVVINAVAGTYEENFRIHAIPGASAANTITFQSETGDSNDVILQHSGYDTANYIVNFDSASHIILQNMTFNSTLSSHTFNCRIIYFVNRANNITVRNNVMFSKELWDYQNERGAIISSYNQGIYDILIDNNLLSKGEVAVSLNGAAGPDQLSGIVVSDNTCINQRERSMSFSYLIAPEIRGNKISQTQHAGRGGISLSYATQGFRILSNRIDMIDPGESCIYIRLAEGAPSGDQRGLVANNMLWGDQNSSSARSALRLEDCKNVRIYHNTIRLRGNTHPTSKALYIYGGSSENIEVQNNILNNSSSGYAIQANGTNYVSAIGHNNYYVNGNFIGRWGGSSNVYTDIESFSAATGETGSVSFSPAFPSDMDLYASSLFLDDEGADLRAAVPADIDGIIRPATPSIGANEYTGTGTPMAGDYTVGGSTPDYPTLTDALRDLEVRGISASVTLNLRDARPFNERTVILPYAGTAADKWITIQSDTSNSSNAIITYSGTFNGDQTIALYRSKYLKMRNLTLIAENQTYGTVVDFAGFCRNDSIVGCTLNGIGRSGSDYIIESKEDILENIHFVGNTFNVGGTGIYIDGYDNDFADNLSFINNTFLDQYYNGIWLQHVNKPVITDNTINTSPTANSQYFAISLNSVPGDFKVLRNKIYNSYGKWGGIYVGSSTASQSFPSLIANNFITLGGINTDVVGIWTNNANYLNIYHNSISILETNNHIESEPYQNDNGSNIKVYNNIFANFSTGRACNITTPSAVIESDYNCFFSGGRNLVKWNGDHGRLDDHQSANSGFDQNSISVNPMFLSENDLHVNSPFVDNKGNTGSTGILTDIDGNLRSSPPDIGADEFTATRSPILAGIYTIGTGGDYPTVKEAFDSLQTRGIAGPVTLRVKTGQYNEYIGRVYEIPGSGDADTIVFESESGNPDEVLIYYSTTVSQYHVFHFRGVDNLTFRNLSVSSTGASQGRPMYISGNVRNFRLVNNRFASANTTHANLWVGNAISDYLLIKDNIITKGHYGISLNGEVGKPLTNTVITGNRVVDASNAGILIRYNYAPKVLNNTVLNQEYGSWEGIQLENCPEDLVVSGNIIDSKQSQYGIYLTQCKATSPFFGLISNNSIHVGGTSYAYGIYLQNSENINVYNNSAHITSSSQYGYAIYSRDGNLNLNIVNNVASNSGGGYAYVVNDGNDIDISDYNTFFTANDQYYAWWSGAAHNNLVALKAASSKDAASIEVDPLFVSDSDLRSRQWSLHEKATPLSDVVYDIDSVPRDLSKPDPGAYEFTCVKPEFNVWVAPSCLGDSTILIDSSLNIAPGSYRRWDLNNDGRIDDQTQDDYETIRWLFAREGNNTVSYAVLQIAGCTDINSISVPVTPAPILEITTRGAYCDTADGSARVRVTNQSGPFKYSWSDPERQSDSVAMGLSVGKYFVAVSNETGCTSTGVAKVGEAIELQFSGINASSCGTPDGSATVTASGGFGPYRYFWSNGDTLPTNNSLPPGRNTVTVFDSKGCSSRGSVNIENTGGPQITPVNISGNACFGEQNGRIEISVTGGTSPYSIRWSNGQRDTEAINNLAAGIYNVIVTDADSCIASGTFQVIQQPRIRVSSIVTPSNCGAADGTAVATVSGGKKPYSYEWSSGGKFQIEEGLAAGVYSVRVVDSFGCEVVEPVFVGEVGAPDVTITEVTGVGCNVTDNGSISIDVTPGTILDVYDWSTEDGSGLSPTENSTQTGLTEGTYTVRVTNDAGCIGYAQAVVRKAPPEVPEICIVTVDTAIGMNQVVWEGSDNPEIAYYNVYRESIVRGEYQLISSVNAGEETLFTDSVADPTIQSWRYKLSAVDVCGNESELSPHHKTIHLTLNAGLTENTVNLLWDKYEGFDAETYTIVRTDATSSWAPIRELSAVNVSFTDDNAPLQSPLYFIELAHPTGCTTSDKKASSFNSSKSNRKTKLKSGETGINDYMSIAGFTVYPNPGSGIYHVNMEFTADQDIVVKVYDIAGKLLLTREFYNNAGRVESRLDLSGYEQGLYHLHIQAGNQLLHRILIKE